MKTLLDWFDQHQRPLPWRQVKSLYRVFISEIMLQQTQVATVIPCFERFIAQFPDVQSLAAAPLESVLRAWEGLGYYRRARMLHQAARKIVAEHGGKFPRDFEAVRALPGIGRYTAGAILSIGLGQRHPILEGNSIRVLTRLYAIGGDVRQPATLNQLWRMAEELVPQRRAGDFNQALMELGSLVCTAAKPCCQVCPWMRWCRAKSTGDPTRFPYKAKRVRLTRQREVAILVQRRGKFLLRRCGHGERWAGMWDFPRYRRPHRHLASVLTAHILADFGLTVVLSPAPFQWAHTVTRYRIELTTMRAIRCTGRLSRRSSGRWVDPQEMSNLPLPVTARRIAREIGEAKADSDSSAVC